VRAVDGDRIWRQDSAGVDLLKSIRTPAEQGRVERLDLSARQLLVASRFFDRGSSISLLEAAGEVRAIHAGDDRGGNVNDARHDLYAGRALGHDRGGR
jgi:hypothetical protein